MSTPTYSGSVFTDATRLVTCPKCEQEASKPCRSPSGRKANTPHWQRCKALREQHPGAIAAATHTSPDPQEVMQKMQAHLAAGGKVICMFG